MGVHGAHGGDAYAKGIMDAWGRIRQDAKDNTGTWKVRERNSQRGHYSEVPPSPTCPCRCSTRGSAKCLPRRLPIGIS